jgi:hypothetical protein
MRRLTVLFVLVACFCFMGAQVHVGTAEKSSPGQLNRCQTLIAGQDDIGTDPTNGAKNAALTDLTDGATTWVSWVDTTIPADVCTAANACPTHAIAQCGLKNYTASHMRLVYDNVGTPTWCMFQCIPPGQNPPAFWVVTVCP